MKLTNFFRLKRALENLDVNFVANKIALLEDSLTQKGQSFDADNTAITQEGIYYIHPESGMAVRVVLYDSDNPVKLNSHPEKDLRLTGFTEEKIIIKLNEYHLVRCNLLTTYEKDGWKKSFRMAQRSDGSFYYRFMVEASSPPAVNKGPLLEIENQRLLVCQNCQMKVNSLLEGVQESDRESFPLKAFFDVDSFGSWCRYGDNFDASESLANMYPHDWQEISRIRKQQVQFMCEGCDTELSQHRLRKYLHVHPIDHVKKKIAYVKLQCLCIGCLAEYPELSHYKAHPDYEAYKEHLASALYTESRASA